ncbi:hypothetical protein RA876_06495 [Rhodoferax antarcticus]|nr:hypothetical protein RA876_06495 [Rhodoferax antarcticus]
MLSVPKGLRYYLQRDKGALNAALHIFLRVVQQSLQSHCPGAAQCDPASLHLGAVAFIHRFGSSLNTHVLLPGVALSPAAHETALRLFSCVRGRWGV